MTDRYQCLRPLISMISILLIAITMSNHVAAETCITPPPGMTNWWPGDGNARDIVSERNGILRNGASITQGFVDQAFVLDGQDDFVDVPHDPSLNVGTGDFTVDVWAYFKTTNGEQILVEKWIQRYPDSEGWSLTKLEGNILSLATADGSGREIGIESGVLPIQPNSWIHFAATRRGNRVTLFVDGVPVATGLSDLNLDSPSSLKFGHRGNPNDTPGSQDTRGFYLNGLIDEVEYFVGQALSDEEIHAIFTAGAAGKCKADAILDHFMCYDAKGATPHTSVELEDTFGKKTDVRVEKPKLFCNPVNKNGEGIKNPEAHMTCYEIKDKRDRKRKLFISNQFGEQPLKVGKAQLLCVPSKKITATSTQK